MSLKLPHFVHHNVVPSLTSRIQLCCIQYRMRGYGLISRANYKLVSHVQGARPITVTAGPVQVQYKISCFTVFALSQFYNLLNTTRSTTTTNSENYKLLDDCKLTTRNNLSKELCNTETVARTRIKRLLVQDQQNQFVSFT